MTNRSYVFTCKGKKYIIRIPGDGTDNLINRKEEALVYNKIKGKGICENLIYINPDNGYKITEFIENARVCDPFNKNDVICAVNTIKKLHSLRLEVDHSFNLFDKIEYYEKLLNSY